MTPFIQYFSTEPCLMEPTALARLASPPPARVALAERFASVVGDKCAEPDFVRRIRAALAPKPEMTRDGIAILNIEGPLAYAPDVWDQVFYGVEDSREVTNAIRALGSNPEVAGVALRINSPGGQVMGGAEMADAVRQLKVPTMAHTGGMMASLAYMVGSQADWVGSTSAAYTGSIGVINTFTDITKYLENLGVKIEVITNEDAEFKPIGVPGTSLSDKARSHIQSRAESIFGQFKSLVRGKRPDVPDSAMRGQVFFGREARASGLVDGIGSFGFAMSKLRRQIGPT